MEYVALSVISIAASMFGLALIWDLYKTYRYAKESKRTDVIYVKTVDGLPIITWTFERGYEGLLEPMHVKWNETYRPRVDNHCTRCAKDLFGEEFIGGELLVDAENNPFCEGCGYDF